MRKLFVLLLALFAFTAVAMVPAMAVTDDEIAALKAQMTDLQKQIDALEAQKAAPAAALPSNLTFHGYFRGRYQLGQNDHNTFESTEVALQPSWDASDRVHGEAHLWFYPILAAGPTFYLESAFMTVDGVGIGNGAKLIAGKARNFAYGQTPTGPSRVTSNYSLYSEAFTHSRITGVQLMNKLDSGAVGLNLALHNGFTMRTTYRYLGQAQFSSLSAAPVLAIGENALDDNDSMGASVRVNGKVSKDLELGLSVMGGRLENDSAAAAQPVPVTTVNGWLTNATGKTTMLNYGLDFRYTDDQWLWQGEVSDARWAGLDFWGMQTLIGYTLNDTQSVYAQYGLLNYSSNIAAASQANVFLWDKMQVSVGYKHKLAKASWIQIEHELNEEDAPTGVNDLDNDVTFVEYFVGY